MHVRARPPRAGVWHYEQQLRVSGFALGQHGAAPAAGQSAAAPAALAEVKELALHPAARFIVVIWSARPAPNGSYTLPPIEATGSGSVQEKQQAYRVEIIQKMNTMFEGRS
jgi:hypothetical protein